MLDLLQAHLEAIYGLRCEHRAQAFLVDPEQAQALGGTGRAREELLVAGGAGGVELALYLEPALLARVSALPPGLAVREALGDFCEVLEGVSHFLYVALAAARERTVSLLELEAQAEVDKYAVCTLLSWGSGAGGDLLGRLFDRATLRGCLSPAERWRYREASRLARGYCGRLARLSRGGSPERLLAELRHGYRLGAQAKLQYFARAG